MVEGDPMTSFHKKLCALAFAVAAACATPIAAKQPNPAPSVAKILAGAADTKGIFTERMEGSAWHIQSGVTCPLAYTNFNLWHLRVYEPSGLDVDCDYGRNGDGDTAVSKLTVFMIKAADGEATEAAFARYRNEVLGAYPDAVSKGPVDEGNNLGDTAVRSEAWDYKFNGHRARGMLIVALRKGWIIEIRVTHLLDSPDSAEMLAGDTRAAGEALIKSIATIGSRDP
jgi:hypothetical protein